MSLLTLDKVLLNMSETFGDLIRRRMRDLGIKRNKDLAEFEARWNMTGLSGGERLDSLLESASGSRLTYEKLTA